MSVRELIDDFAIYLGEATADAVCLFGTPQAAAVRIVRTQALHGLFVGVQREIMPSFGVCAFAV